MEEVKPDKEKDKKAQKDYLYKVERVCGNGSFGIVFQAKIIHTGETVAIKKVYQDKRYKNREYAITKELNHPNIVKLLHAFYTTGEKQDEIYLNMVLNYVPDNLNRIIRNHVKNKEEFPIFLVKLYSFQMIRAIAYIHSLDILNRDIKPQNVLVDISTNRVYLCDFGSAKRIRKENNVAYICSRYYRAPELIFSNQDYDSSIDIWSFGCVMAEMLLGKPLFQGESTVDQLLQIIKVLGTPDAEQLQYLNRNNTLSYQFPPVKPYSLSKIFNGKPKEVIDLLQKLLVYEPQKRLNALEIMAHPFFDELRNSESTNNGKFIIPQIFDFTESKELITIAEIQNYTSNSTQQKLLLKIIPEWAETYKLIFSKLKR